MQIEKDVDMLKDFMDDEEIKLQAINYLSELPEAIGAISEVVYGLNKQRVAFMFLLLKLMIDSGIYELEVTEEELAYYIGHALRIVKNTSNNKITITVVFSNEEKEDGT
jgi:hypothetical protein